jgi:ferredoxin
VDIFQALPVPVLTVMDALRGMDGPSGPSNGRVLGIGKLLAGRNAVAVDAVMAMMAGTKPDRVPMLRIAAGRGLGPGRLDVSDVQGDSTPVPGFRLPTILVANVGTFLSGWAYTATASRPILTPDRCTRCGRCAESCPVDAIALAPMPAIAFRRCISCYCCVEVCPERALAVRRGIGGLLRRLASR